MCQNDCPNIRRRFQLFFVYLDMFYASLLIIHINGRIYNRTGQSPSQMNVNEKGMNN